MDVTSEGNSPKPKLATVVQSENMEDEEVSFQDIIYTDSRTKAKSGKNVQSKEPSDEYVCKEACCGKIEKDFKCKSEWGRHAEATHHKTAVILGTALRAHLPPGDALDEEQAAIKGLICNALECPAYDQRFPTLNTYFTHLTKPEHLAGAEENVRMALVEGIEKADLNLVCKKAACPKHGQTFSSICGYKLHLASRPHMGAHEPDTPYLAPQDSFGLREGFTNSLFSPITPAATFTQASPLSPSVGRDRKQAQENSFKKVTLHRSGTSKKREEELMERNSELEARVKRLEEELAEVRPLFDMVKQMGLK